MNDDEYYLLKVYRSGKYPGGLIGLFENARTGERTHHYYSYDSVYEALKKSWEEDDAVTETTQRGK